MSKSKGQCPVCKSRRSSADIFVYEGDYGYYPYDCNDCGNTGKEYYTIVYDITSTRITDEHAKQILKTDQ